MRVMTWNLWWRFGPWQQRQPAIRAELGVVDADVILLQEVWFDETDGDQAQQLADHLGFHMVRTRRIDGAPQPFGNAILSRWPLSQAETVRLPGPDGQPSHRSVLLAEVQAPHGAQAAATTHLEWRYDHSLTRQSQLEFVARVISTRWPLQRDEAGEPEGFPVILGGDMNAVPASDEIRRLTGLAAPYVPGLIFTDAWAAVSDAPGYTWHRDNPHSRDAQWPRRRVDYLLSSWPRRKPSGNPLKAWLAGQSEHDGIVPSDHDAVVVEFDTRASVTPTTDGQPQ